MDRKLADGIPFEWHRHHEYALPLTRNGQGVRYVGSDVEWYGTGDLVLLGPDLPHSPYAAGIIGEAWIPARAGMTIYGDPKCY